MKIAIKDQMDRKNVGWSTYLPKHYLQLVLPGVRNTFMAKEMKKDLQDGRLKKNSINNVRLYPTRDGCTVAVDS